jgi:rhodanese-related sulfurtransferase
MDLKDFAIPAAAVAFLGWRLWSAKRVRAQVRELNAAGAQIVDVRTAAEFAAANNPRSMNIPLDTLDAGVLRLDKTRPVIVCCATGTRSAMGTAILKRRGFPRVVNAGRWTNTLA